MGAADELLHRPAGHPGSAGPMLEQGSGSIVNVASVNSFFQPDAATIDYGVAKAAVVNLSKSLSQEFGPKGIRVNCVSPGQVSTDLWLGEHGVAATFADATGVDADTIRATATAAIATGRFTHAARRSRRSSRCSRPIAPPT